MDALRFMFPHTSEFYSILSLGHRIHFLIKSHNQMTLVKSCSIWSARCITLWEDACWWFIRGKENAVKWAPSVSPRKKQEVIVSSNCAAYQRQMQPPGNDRPGILAPTVCWRGHIRSCTRDEIMKAATTKSSLLLIASCPHCLDLIYPPASVLWSPFPSPVLCSSLLPF